jgi:hypothetical protein
MPCQSHQALISSNNHENSTAKKVGPTISQNWLDYTECSLRFPCLCGVVVNKRVRATDMCLGHNLVWLHSHIDRGSKISQYRIAQGHL